MFRTLGKQFKDRWGKSSKSKRRAGRLAATRQRSASRKRLWLEPLEDRTLLSINFSTLANDLAGDLGNLTKSLASKFSSADPIPLVGTHLSQVDVLSSRFNDLTTNKLSPIGVSSDPNTDIGMKLPGATAMYTDPAQSQVDVTIPLFQAPGSPQELAFDLSALNNFLVVNAGSRNKNFQVTEGFNYTLTFHYDDRADNGAGLISNLGGPLTLNVTAQSAPGQPLTFTGTLNANPDPNHTSLYAQGTDHNGNTKLTADLGVSIDPNNGNVTNIVLNDGSANADINLNLRFGDPSKNLPFNLTPQADLVLTWSFSNNSIIPPSPQDQLGQITKAQFDNVQLGLTSLVQGIGDSAIHRIQEFTEPLQPIANFLGAELPGLSSLGIHISLASVFGLSDLVNFINGANDAVNAFSSFENQADSQISYGDLVIGAPGGNILAALRSGQETIVSGQGGTDGKGGVSVQSPATTFFQTVENDLHVFHISGDRDQNSFMVNVAFPIVDNSSADQCPLYQLLEGDVAAQFFKVNANFSISTSINLPPVPIAFILLEPSFTIGIGLNLTFGYDATGLKAASIDPNTSNDALTSDLKSGFFFVVGKGNTDISLNAGMTLTASAVIAEVSGTLAGEITFGLASDQQVGNPGGSTRERHFDSNMQEGFSGDAQCGFGSNMSGDIYLEVGISIGFDIPLVGHVNLFSFDFPKIDLLSFSSMCTAGALTAPPPTIEVPVGNGDHTIHIHRYTVVGDPTNPHIKLTGIEVDDNSNNTDWPSTTKRYPTYEFDDQTNAVTKSLGQVQQIAVFPVEIVGQSPISGKDSVVIDPDVVGDDSGDPVKVLMIGHDGVPNDNGGDDLEYFGPYALYVDRQVVMIGGKGNNKLVGGRLEFGGGAPPDVAARVKSGYYFDFPGWAQNLTVYNQLWVPNPFGPGYVSANLPTNPLASIPAMVADDGHDVLVGTPWQDYLYGGSTNNAFVGLGGGDQIHGDAGNPFSNGVNNTFLESALDNYPNPNGTTPQEDNNFENVIGGNGVNSLQFVGFVDGEKTDNISVSGAFPDSSGFFPYILVNDGLKHVLAASINQLTILADSGSVFIDDLVNTDVSKVDISFTHPDPVQDHQVTVVTTEVTGTLNNYFDGHWTVALDRKTGGTALTSRVGLEIGIQGLTDEEGLGNGSSTDHIILDDTRRISSSSDTIDIQSLPSFGPALTVNLGPGTDQVNVTPARGLSGGLLDDLNGDTVNINGHSAGFFQLPTDTLSIDDSTPDIFDPHATGSSTWDVTGSTVTRDGNERAFGHVIQAINYKEIGTLNVLAGFDPTFDFTPTSQNLDELPPDIFLRMTTGSLPYINVYDQSDSQSENWTVTATEITRSQANGGTFSYLYDRHIFFPGKPIGSPSPIIDIEGGRGDSQFQLDPKNGPNAGANLAELQMFVTINGHGANDTLEAHDENDPVTQDLTWNVPGFRNISDTYGPGTLKLDESNLTQDQEILFSNIENLVIDYPGTAFNHFIFGPDNHNLTDLPRNIQFFTDINHSFGLDATINDQNNGQHFDSQDQLNPTTWTITNDSIVRKYREASIFPGIDVVVARTISLGVLPTNLTILAGSGDDAFQVQRTGSLQFVPPEQNPEPPTFLTIDGGGGNNSLTTTDGIDTTYTIQPGSLFKKQIESVNDTTGVPDSFYLDTVNFAKMARVTIDDSVPSSGDPGFATPFYTFNVVGTGAGTATTLKGSPGVTNTFNVADPSVIQGPLQLDGGGTDNTINRIPGFQEFPVPNQLSHPNTITTGPDGSLWFTDSFDGTIGRISTAGPPVSEFPIQTFGNLVIGPDNKLWFVGQNGNIERFDPTNPVNSASVVYQPTKVISSNLVSTPTGVWFAEFDYTGSQVVRVDTTGNAIAYALSSSEIAKFLTRGPDGKSVWFLEQADTAFSSPNLLGVIDSLGQFSQVSLQRSAGFALGGNLTGLTAGPDGNVWATSYIILGKGRDEGIFAKIDSQGDVTGFRMPNNNPLMSDTFVSSKPRNIVAGKDGNLWFVDQDRGGIDVANTSGGIQEFGFPQAGTLTAEPDGNMWFIGGSDVGRILVGTQPTLWQINGPDIGQLYSNVFFNSIQNLNGGISPDAFDFTAKGSISGKVAGGLAQAILDESQSLGVQVTSDGPNTGTLHGSKGMASNIDSNMAGGFNNIDTIITSTAQGVKFDDTANTSPTAWTISSTSVTRQVQGQGATTTPLANPTSLEIDAGLGGNTFNILGTTLGVPLTINGGSGGDAYNFGDPTHPLTDLQGPMTLNPGAGANSMMVDASGTPIAVDVSVDLASALITQIGLPALDASSKDVGKMTVHFGADVNLAGGVHFITGSQLDSLGLQGLPTNSPFSMMGNGQGSLTLGGMDGLDDIHSDVNILAPTTVTLNDLPDHLPGIYTLTSSSLTFAHPSTITSSTDGLTINFPHNPSLPMTILGGSGGNRFNIESIDGGHATSLVTGGNDIINVGNNGSVQGILDSLSIVGTGTTLVVDDSADPTPRIVTITTTSITGLAPAVINYAGISNLTVDGGYGGNTIFMQNTAAGTDTTVNSGNGTDVVYVEGTTGPLTVNTQQSGVPSFTGFDVVIVGAPIPNVGDTLDPIQGALTVDTSQGFGDLGLYDTATSASEQFTVTHDTIARSGMAPIHYVVTNELFFYLGSGGDNVNIQSTSPGLLTVFVGGVGNDTFNVGDAANTLNSIQGHLSFSIANPGSRVILNDQDDTTPLTFTLATTLTGGGTGFVPSVARSNSPYVIFYNGPLQQLVLNTGSSGNTVNVQKIRSSTAVTINGAGLDTVNVGNPTDGVGDIQGPLNIKNNPAAGGYTALTVDDSAFNRGYWYSTLTNNSLTTNLRKDNGPLVSVAPIIFNSSELRSLTILLGTSIGASGNIVFVTDTPTSAYAGGMMTTISTGISSSYVSGDQIYVGATTGPLTVNLNNTFFNPAVPGVLMGGGAATLDNIHGAVTVNGSSGYTDLSLFDYGNSTGQTYTITDSTVAFRPNLLVVNYHVKNEVFLYASSGVNTINLKSMASAAYIDAGLSGKDVITVGDSSNTLDGIIGGYLYMQIEKPGNQAILNDQGKQASLNYAFTFLRANIQAIYRTDTASDPLTEIFYSGPLQNLTLNSSYGADRFNVQTLPANVAQMAIMGHSGTTNTLQGPDTPNTWQITGANVGTLDNVVASTSVQNLIGGSANDTFAFKAGGSLAGKVDGGAGTNKLDYSAYLGDVQVDLPLHTASAVAGGIANIQNATGSIGNDLLVGDANANVFVGGTGRNILIGGAGQDNLTGSVNQDNILIGGATLWDTKLNDLMLIMHEWLRTDLNFDQRLSDISSGGVGVLNSVLTGTGVALNNSTVFHDNVADTLIESSTNTTGRYWFFIDAIGDDIVPFSKTGKNGDHFTKV